MKDFKNISEYALDVWETQLGAPVIEELDSVDYSESYEVDRAHLVKLGNDKYAVISESGCSCYDYSDAHISVYDTLGKAATQFEAYRK